MRDDKIDVSNCAQLVVIASRTVINNLELKFGMAFLIALTPRLEVRREFVVGHNVNRFQIGNAREIVQQPFDDWFAADQKQRFGFVQRQRVKAGCVSGSENQNVHEIKEFAAKQENARVFSTVSPSPAEWCPSNAAEGFGSVANQ